MKFGVLCIVFAVLEKARAALSPAGENVCLVDEKYIAVVQVRELVPVTVYKVEWCWKIPPRCTVETESFKPTLITKHIPRVRIVPKCCNGYKEIPEESKCVPSCSEPCVHGTCVHPETCSCTSGYHGLRCDKHCMPGTWGRGCLEKCDCSGNGDCDRVNGICTCLPGWRGYRCDYPCDPGRYGRNCETRCNCDGELCNHVSGECEAITVTTLATAGNATTTEETIFETTTEEITAATDATEAVTGYAIPDVTVPTEEYVEHTGVDENVSYPIEMVLEIENTTLIIDDIVSRDPDNVRIYVQPETPKEAYPVTEIDDVGTDAQSETPEVYPVTEIDVSREPDIVRTYFQPETTKTYPVTEVSREPDIVRTYIQPEAPKGVYPTNETDADNEIDGNYSADVQKTKFNILNLLENLSIVCGVFVIIMVLTMCAVLVSHHKKMKKVGIECRKDSNMNSQEYVIHRFYGGCITPAKTILDNQVTATNLDFDMELPKLMTFKPLPEEKADKEYFMRTNESQDDNFDVANENPLSETILNNDYNNQLAQFEYDVPKSTSFVPARFKYG